MPYHPTKKVFNDYPDKKVFNDRILTGRYVSLHNTDWSKILPRDESITTLDIYGDDWDGREIFKILGEAYPNLRHLWFSNVEDFGCEFLRNEDINACIPSLKTLRINESTSPFECLDLEDLDMGSPRLDELHMSVDTSWRMDVSHIKHLRMAGSCNRITVSHGNTIEKICTTDDFLPDGIMLPHLTQFYLFHHDELSGNHYHENPLDCQRIFDLAPNLTVFGMYGPSATIRSASLRWCSISDGDTLILDCPHLQTLELTNIPTSWTIHAPELTTLRFILHEDMLDDDIDDPWVTTKAQLARFIGDLRHIELLVIIEGDHLREGDPPLPIIAPFQRSDITVIEGDSVHPFW